MAKFRLRSSNLALGPSPLFRPWACINSWLSWARGRSKIVVSHTVWHLCLAPSEHRWERTFHLLRSGTTTSLISLTSPLSLYSCSSLDCRRVASKLWSSFSVSKSTYSVLAASSSLNFQRYLAFVLCLLLSI
jgi:hypothetical protein